MALIVTAPLAVAPGSWAASAGAGTDDFDVLTACATWSDPTPPDGKTVTVSVCGQAATNSRDMVFASESGPDRFTAQREGYGLEAVRSTCQVDEPHLCERSVYLLSDAAPEDVAIDPDAGTARLRAVIRDCAFDVTVTAELQDSPDTAPNVQPTVSTAPLFMFTSTERRTVERGEGPAAGSVCDWGDVVVGEGAGSLVRERRARTEAFVFPFQ